MKQYLLCLCFWAVFTVFLYGFGNVLAPQKNHSYKLVMGYLVYSFFVALGGIPLQLLNAPWICFAAYMGLVWIFIVAVIVLGQVKFRIKIYDFHLKEYICENWMLYIISAVMIAMLFFYYAGFWLGDHQDDGYYINRVANLPTMTLGGNFNFAVGVENSGFNSYIVNTWEAEASVYVKLLGVVPTLFLRIFQSSFYYFLIANLFKLIGDAIFEKIELQQGSKFSQFVPIFFPLICTNFQYLKHQHILDMRDNFFTETGMFLGASVVRLCGLGFFILWYLENEREDNDHGLMKILFGSGLIAVVMMSKSTIVLPLLVMAGVPIASMWLVEHYGKLGKMLVLGGGSCYLLLGIFLPNNASVQDDVWGNAQNSLTSYGMIPFIIIFILSFFILKNRWVYKLNILILTMACLALLPQCNDVFEKFSIYGFVGGRAWTALVYLFIIVNTSYFLAILQKIKLHQMLLRGIAFALFIALSGQMLYAFTLEGGNLVTEDLVQGTDLASCFQVFKENTKAVPNSTMYLGEALEELAAEEGSTIRVIMPKFVIDNDAYHCLAVSVRAFAPDIVSVSANERFRVNSDETISTYFQENYDAFITEPNDKEKVEAFGEEIQGRSIDCIVTLRSDLEEPMKELGYSYYGCSRDGSYYLWRLAL